MTTKIYSRQVAKTHSSDVVSILDAFAPLREILRGWLEHCRYCVSVVIVQLAPTLRQEGS